MKEIDNLKELHEVLKYSDFIEENSCHVLIPCTISPGDSINHYFEHWIFEKDVVFKGEYKNRVEIKNCVFNENVSFNDVVFKSKVKIYSCRFKNNVNFANTKFEDLADFWNTHFFKKVIFYKTDFNGVTVFAITKFYENVLFTYSLISKVAIFRHTKFRKGLDLSLAIISGTCSFFDIELKDYTCINKFSKEKVEEEFEKAVSEDGVIPINNKRETFRIIKNQLKSQGNNFDAIKYSNLETKIFAKQVVHKTKSNCLSSKPIGDLIILFLNLISNNHGKTWSRGLLFTLSIGVLFFSLSVKYTDIYLSDYNCNFYEKIYHQFPYFVSFINPTHDINYLTDFNPSNLFYFFDFIGRLFVGYGIYQTIQAFRKFKT